MMSIARFVSMERKQKSKKLTNSLVGASAHISYRELDPNPHDQLGEFLVTRNPRTREVVLNVEHQIRLC